MLGQKAKGAGQASLCAAALAAIALVWTGVAAADTHLGKPLIYNFDRRDFGAGAEVQHWDVLQDNRGVMYFADNGGVLEYDGRTWRLIELPSRVGVRAVTQATDGTGPIYVGAIGDFGYLRGDEAGQLQFVSLLPPEARSDPAFDQVFRPVMAPDGVYFHGKSMLCHFKTELRCQESDPALSMLFSTPRRLYGHRIGTGLLEFVNGEPRPVAGGGRFASSDVRVVLSYPHAGGEGVLVGTRDFRFFVQHDRSFEPFPTDAPDSARQDHLLDGVVLPDGSFAFATLLRGVLIVGQHGHVLQQIDQAAGLQDNHVHALHTDRQGGIWTALQNGVSRIEAASPFTILDEGSGLEREWREVIQHGGMVYVRGYKGLFAAALPASSGPHVSRPRPIHFERIADVTPPVWGFVAAADRLVVTSQDGLHEVIGRRTTRIATYLSTPMAVYRSRRDPSRVYVGLAGGVASVRFDKGVWRDEGHIGGVDETITSVGEDDRGGLWLVSQRQRVVHVTVDANGAQVVHAYPLGAHGLTGRISLREIHGRTVFLTEAAILEFDTASERFVPFAATDALRNKDRRSFSWIADDGKGSLWIASRKPARIDRLVRQPNGTYTLDNSGVRQALAWSIYPEAQSAVVWLSTPDYLVRYDPAVRVRASDRFATLLRKVTAGGDRVVYGGAPAAGRPSRTPDPQLAYRANSLQFEFAAPRFDDAGRNEFQSYLEGFDTQWSAWSTDPTRIYTNLPKGQYRFRVRARDVHGTLGEDAMFAFAIGAPWYLTGWAYALYSVLAVGFLLVVSKYERRRAHIRLAHRLEHMELEKLRELDRLKSRFFADISHEFRTPLTLILGPVGQMLHEEQSPERVGRLRLIRKNAQYLLRLISQLLDLSKLESGKMRLHATRGNVVHALEPIVAPFEAIAEQHGIELKFPVASAAALEGTEVYFDGDVLQKILNNLLGNAFKFTPPGGTVAVDVRRAGEWVEIVVSDTGPGIAREHLAHVFDRFYQVEGASVREGIGIGLALVRELVDLHHGEIRVESEEGHGTTFLVRLRTGRGHLAPDEFVDSAAFALRPVAPAPLDLELANIDREAADVVPPDEQPEDETTVLIVEDHAEVRQFLRDHLQKYYKVLEAGNGAEGLATAMATLPDLVLSDVMMQSMDGYELCRALKTNERTCHIPIVLLTAKATREDKLQGLDTGADCYLIKPFDALELLMQVRNLIDQRRRLRERFGGPVVLRPSEIGVTPMDEAFLTKVLTVVQNNLQDPAFDVERLGREVGLSRSQLHRKLRALTNQPPTLMIRSIRLQRAAELLAQKTGSVAEIAYFVGFNSQAYFAKCFREQFGCSPKEYTHRVHPPGQLPAPVPFPHRPERRRA